MRETNDIVVGSTSCNEIIYQDLADYWVRSAIEAGNKCDCTILQRCRSFNRQTCYDDESPQFSYFLEEDISMIMEDDETNLDSSTIVSCDDRDASSSTLFDNSVHHYEMDISSHLLCSENDSRGDGFIICNDNHHTSSLFLDSSSFPDMPIPASPIRLTQSHTMHTPIDNTRKKHTTMRTISPDAVFDFPEPMYPPKLVMCLDDSHTTNSSRHYNKKNNTHDDDDDLFLLPDFHSDLTQYKLDLPYNSELEGDVLSSKLDFPTLPDQVPTQDNHNYTMTSKRQMSTPFLSPK